ncbi:hypothetical protein AXF42_Ash020124 [Apostasia shenzhenica]|uniref:Uncharacterized protein n=1 Tax=Apostasia shenzhenica TaxID=1088818 RepID=A0A2I0A3R8_9ASPA|nr:hypothetical protein AXF42_Ash020124 [Apostasia shenzhenica]
MDSPSRPPSPLQSPSPAPKRGWFRRLRSRRGYRWPWMTRLSSTLRYWKRIPLRFSLLHELSFRLLYVLEGVVLLATVVFFVLFCGCHL